MSARLRRAFIVIISVASLFVDHEGSDVTSDRFGGGLHRLRGCGRVRWTNAAHAAAEAAKTIQTVGMSDVSFLIVGLLAARLSERQSRSDVELAAATQSLANLRALHERIVESIRSGLITTDLQGRIYSFNAAAEEITGYHARDVRGKNASIFFGDMTQRIADSMRARRRTCQPRFEAMLTRWAVFEVSFHRGATLAGQVKPASS